MSFFIDNYIIAIGFIDLTVVNVWGKRFKLPWLTHERFLTIDHSCKIFFWYLPNWTSTDLWCVVLNVTYSTTHQRSVEVQFDRYQKNILQEWYMAKNLSCDSHGSLKRFPHTFTTKSQYYLLPGTRRTLILAISPIYALISYTWCILQYFTHSCLFQEF